MNDALAAPPASSEPIPPTSKKVPAETSVDLSLSGLVESIRDAIVELSSIGGTLEDIHSRLAEIQGELRWLGSSQGPIQEHASVVNACLVGLGDTLRETGFPYEIVEMLHRIEGHLDSRASTEELTGRPGGRSSPGTKPPKTDHVAEVLG